MLALLQSNLELDIYWPAICTLLAAGVCISIDLSSKDKEAIALPVLFTALAGIVLAFYALASEWLAGGPPREALMGGVMLDRFGLFLSGGILLGTLTCCFTSINVIDRLKVSFGDHIALVLVAASGMLFLVVSNDLIMVFLSIELMSLAIYVLAGINRDSGRSIEAAMKYFVMGAFASGFLLMGMAIIYGVTGQVQLGAIAASLATMPPELNTLAMLGAGLVLIGLAFKVGAVPFHQWVPDAYTGAPTPVTGFMAVAVKIAAFGALGRIMFQVFSQSELFGQVSGDVLWVLAAATMLLGNWLAVTQESVKRMLAYSSIAHSGYLLMGLVAARDNSAGMEAILFYLIVYAFATGGAFALLTYTTGDEEADDYRDLRGIAWRRPWIAVAMTIFMVSLAGIPLTGGFLGKYYLFYAAVDARLYTLAVIGIVSSMIGAYYYLRVVVFLYMKEPEVSTYPGTEHWGVKLTLVVSAACTMFLGIMPSSVLDRASHAVRMLPLSRHVGIVDRGEETSAGDEAMVEQSTEVGEELTEVR